MVMPAHAQPTVKWNKIVAYGDHTFHVDVEITLPAIGVAHCVFDLISENEAALPEALKHHLKYVISNIPESIAKHEEHQRLDRV